MPQRTPPGSPAVLRSGWGQALCRCGRGGVGPGARSCRTHNQVVGPSRTPPFTRPRPRMGHGWLPGPMTKVFGCGACRRTGRRVPAAQVLTGQSNAMSVLAFSADSTHLISAGGERPGPPRPADLKVYQLAPQPNGAPLYTLRGHRAGISALSVDRAGRIASASLDGTVRVWPPNQGMEGRRFPGHRGEVFNVAFRPSSHEGEVLASASKDGSVKLWSGARGRYCSDLDAHPKGALGLAFSA